MCTLMIAGSLPSATYSINKKSVMELQLWYLLSTPVLSISMELICAALQLPLDLSTLLPSHKTKM